MKTLIAIPCLGSISTKFAGALMGMRKGKKTRTREPTEAELRAPYVPPLPEKLLREAYDRMRGY